MLPTKPQRIARRCRFIPGLAFICLVPFSLGAQEAKPDGEAQTKEKRREETPPDLSWLREIVVTGRKHSVREKELGRPIIIITEEELARSEGRGLAELLQEYGVVTPGTYGNLGSNKSPFIQGADSKYTAVLLNGVPMKSPLGSTNLNLFHPEELARVEIAEGGGSTLYGSNAVGGVINLITKKEEKKRSLSGYLMGGSYATYKGNMTAGGSFRVRKTPFHVLASYTNHRSGGISEAKAPKGATDFDEDAFTGQSVYGSVQTELSKEVSLDLHARYAAYETDFDTGPFQDHTNSTLSPGTLTGTTNIRYHYGKGTMKCTGNIQRYWNDRRTGAENNKQVGSSQIFDLFVKHDLTKFLYFTAGIDARKYRLRDVDDRAGNDFDTLSSSPYALVTLRGWKNFHCDVGLRHNTHSDHKSKLTYQITPHYYLSPNTKLFASYNTSYRSPEFNELYDLYGTGALNKTLKAESAQNIEGGMQLTTTVKNRRLRGVFSFFMRRIRDGIVYTPTEYANQKEQNDYGFQISPRLLLHENTQLLFTYRYLNGKGTQNDANGEKSVRHHLIRRPKHSLSGTWQQQYKKLRLRLNMQWRGERTDVKDYNTGEEAHLPAYVLLNLRGTCALSQKKWGKLSTHIALNNLTNATFQEAYGYSTWGFHAFVGLRYTY